MPIIKNIEQQILSLEGFRAEFRDRKSGKDVNGNLGGLKSYPYVRKASGSRSVSDWIESRFFKHYTRAAFDVWVYDQNNNCVNGKTLLSNVRKQN